MSANIPKSLSQDLSAMFGVVVLVNFGIAFLVMPMSFFLWVRATYTFNTVVIPGSLVLIVCLRWLRAKRSGDRPLGIPVLLIVAVVLVGIRVWATHIEPGLVQVRQVELVSERVSAPLKILHISDLQADLVDRYEERLFSIMGALEPDLVLFTGDLLQPWPPATISSELPKVESLLRILNPPLGLFGVCGNTDGQICASGPPTIAGLRVLAGEGVDLVHGGKGIAIYGLRLAASQTGTAFDHAARQWLADRRAVGSFNVVLGHGPDFAMAAPQESVDLALAGHTHGGQIRVPGFGPLLTLSSVPRSWARGFRFIGPMALNVSAGLGAEHAAGLPPIRVNCPPEMTVIDVIPGP